MSYWRSKRVLVTGATGLVGSWLVKKLLERDAAVVAFIRDCDPQSELVRGGWLNRISVVNGSLENYRDVERAICDHEIDTVFHLGAQTIVGTALRNPLGTFEANIRGTWNVLDACRVHADLVQRVIVASSDKAYGPGVALPYVEEMPALGRFPYDVSKSCADLIAQSYFHTYGLPVAIARCVNVYGGGDLNWSRIVPGTIRSLHWGNRPILRSDGMYTRDFVYVEDAAQAYLAIAEFLHRDDVRGEAFNFGPARPFQVREIVDTLRGLMHREDLEPILLDEARAEIRDQYVSSSKAEKLLNWKPVYTLEDGLSESVEWYRRLFDAA
ncbi:MAG: GDP-mannose 4,6-dehydratase [Acidobacteriota bacterium]|nr:GDP-mannose 4,6-dehydratase [Acidobacteriota bacterium]